MSFSSAIGQIDQIVQLEQQLTDPATLTQTSRATGTNGTAATAATTARSAI
jgi:hypothetical protein